MIDLSWLKDLTGWISPEQRMKQKRVKREALKEEREKVSNMPCTLANIRRIEAIDAELKKIERDLVN